MQPASSKVFASRSFAIFLVRFFPSLAATVVMILFSRRLPVNTWGGYSTFWIHANMLLPLLTVGIHSLLLTYPPQRIAQFASTIRAKQLITFAAWAGVVGAAVVLWQGISASQSYAIAAFVLLLACTLILESILIVFESYKLLIWFNLAYSAVYLLAHWWWLGSTRSMSLLFGILTLLVAAKLIAYSIGVHRVVRLPVSESIEVAPAHVTRSLWLHLALFDGVQVFSTWIDKFAVAWLLTNEETALYYNGTQNIPFLPVILAATSAAVLMQLSANSTPPNAAEAGKVMHQAGRLLSCIVFPVFAFLLLFSHELITQLLTAKYAAVAPIFAATLLVLPVRAYSFTTVLQRLHQGRIINTGAVGELVLAAALMYPLYSLAGLPGLAFSFVISTYCQAMYYLLRTAKLLGASIVELIPLSHWIVKMSFCLGIFELLKYGTHSIADKKIVLILGAGLVAAVVSSMLYIELKKPFPHVGSKQQK